MISKIYLDMDGVLCDFNARVNELDAHKLNKEGQLRIDWDKMDQIGPSAWSEIKWIPEGKELYNYLVNFCNKHNIVLGILSAIYLKNGKAGKYEWLAKNCPEIKPDDIHIINNGINKDKSGAKDILLIDDNAEVCEKYAKIGPVSHFNRNPLHNIYESILNYYLV